MSESSTKARAHELGFEHDGRRWPIGARVCIDEDYPGELVGGTEELAVVRLDEGRFGGCQWRRLHFDAERIDIGGAMANAFELSDEMNALVRVLIEARMIDEDGDTPIETTARTMIDATGRELERICRMHWPRTPEPVQAVEPAIDPTPALTPAKAVSGDVTLCMRPGVKVRAPWDGSQEDGKLIEASRYGVTVRHATGEIFMCPWREGVEVFPEPSDVVPAEPTRPTHNTGDPVLDRVYGIIAELEAMQGEIDGLVPEDNDYREHADGAIRCLPDVVCELSNLIDNATKNMHIDAGEQRGKALRRSAGLDDEATSVMHDDDADDQARLAS